MKVWGDPEYLSQIEGSHGGLVHGFSLKLGWAVVLVLGEPKSSIAPWRAGSSLFFPGRRDYVS